VLAGLLATLTFATIAHVLLSSVKRRRHDLAVLKTIGLVSGQLRAVVIWQALAITALSLAVGLPLGVAAGRWAWLIFARDTGFVPEVVTELVPLAVVVAGAAVLSTAVAWVVGGVAARTPAAMVLRSE
jgi:ABC-type lipoprotein release transport system permease subunit